MPRIPLGECPLTTPKPALIRILATHRRVSLLKPWQRQSGKRTADASLFRAEVGPLLSRCAAEGGYTGSKARLARCSPPQPKLLNRLHSSLDFLLLIANKWLGPSPSPVLLVTTGLFVPDWKDISYVSKLTLILEWPIPCPPGRNIRPHLASPTRGHFD